MTTGLDRRARKTSRRQGRRGHRLLDGARARADRIRSSFALDRLARLGLIARTVLYLLLSYLTVRVATGSGTGGKQANANGALSEVARTPIGEALVVAAAVGFAAFAVARFVSAAAGLPASFSWALPPSFFSASGGGLAFFAFDGSTTGATFRSNAEASPPRRSSRKSCVFSPRLARK